MSSLHDDDGDDLNYRLVSTAVVRELAQREAERLGIDRLSDKAIDALRAAYVDAADELMAWACLLAGHRRGRKTMQPSDVLLAGAITLPAHRQWCLERNENLYGENYVIRASPALRRKQERLRALAAGRWVLPLSKKRAV